MTKEIKIDNSHRNIRLDEYVADIPEMPNFKQSIIDECKQKMIKELKAENIDVDQKSIVFQENYYGDNKHRLLYLANPNPIKDL